MHVKSLLMLAALLTAGILLAQPPMALFSEIEGGATTLGSGKGEPVPDGTEVIIYWDANGNGPDDSDQPPVVGEKYGEANMDRFVFNAAEMGLEPGSFYPPLFFTLAGNIVEPSRYYLRVCLDGKSLVSNVIMLESGPQEIEVEEWTLDKNPCRHATPVKEEKEEVKEE